MDAITYPLGLKFGWGWGGGGVVVSDLSKHTLPVRSFLWCIKHNVESFPISFSNIDIRYTLLAYDYLSMLGLNLLHVSEKSSDVKIHITTKLPINM